MWLTEVIISVSASACESSRASRVSSDEETVCGYCAVAPPGGWRAARTVAARLSFLAWFCCSVWRPHNVARRTSTDSMIKLHVAIDASPSRGASRLSRVVQSAVIGSFVRSLRTKDLDGRDWNVEYVGCNQLLISS
jgi:hypothetical protein